MAEEREQSKKDEYLAKMSLADQRREVLDEEARIAAI